MFALPVCDIKTKGSRKSRQAGPPALASQDISQAIPTVVLKLAALANNSEPDYPTFFQLRFWLPNSNKRSTIGQVCRNNSPCS